MSKEELEEENVEFKGIIYMNQECDNPELVDNLPLEMKAFYKEVNGLVAYNGGFQIRQIGTGPTWNSLENYWTGENALHKIYPNLSPDDIPFAQDCMGDQYVFRGGSVWQLLTETGDLDDLELEFDEFIDEVIEDPVEFLALYPLIDFLDAGKELEVGQLLVPNIPFSEETENEYTFTTA
ncbi:MAG: SMI1/KNR4 family protein, partial [Salibacteraceae bacterium]